MSEKPIDWRGSSLRDIKDDDIFTSSARKEAGHQLGRVQVGLEPEDWKPFQEENDFNQQTRQGNYGDSIQSRHPGKE